jgi:hypothetical protein
MSRVSSNEYDREYEDEYQINERLINSIMRLRTSLEYSSMNRNSMYSVRIRTNVLESMNILTRFITTDEYDTYESLNNLDNVKITLSEEQFNKLKNCTITTDCENECKCNTNLDEDNPCLSNGECHICLDGFKKGENKVFLKCKHNFHKECIYKWLCYEKTNCPICRYDVRESPELR